MPTIIRNKKLSEVLAIAQYFNNVTSLQIVLAIHPSGVTIAKSFYNAGEGIQENLVSAALSVITTFESEISDQMGIDIGDKKGKIHTVDYKNFTITVFDGKFLRIGIISIGKLFSIMRDNCWNLLNTYEMAHSYDLKDFSGETSIFSDFSEVVDKNLDGKLNKICKINHHSLAAFTAPKKVIKILGSMHSIGDRILPGKVPAVLVREAKISETDAQYYTFDAYKCYVLEPC